MKRHISLLLCFVLALTVISPMAIEQSKTKRAQAASAPVEQVCELEDLRTKTSETYLLSDGTRECVVYAENKYYEDAQGKLERIDNSIIETKYSFNKKEYHYQNAANETAVYFAENEPAVLAVYGSNTLAYNLVGGNETSAIAGGSKKFGQVGDYSLCGNNYIAYHGVAEQTDLVFAVHNSGVKEYIVLGNDTAPIEFVFRFEHAGYSIKGVEYGRLGFFDEKGEMVFTLGSLYAVDAAGKYTDQVVYDLKEYDDTSATIAIKLSESYMQDPERVFPILIDPSVAMTGADQTYDTFVSSKFPNTNYFEDNHLRTGYDDDLYVRRTYMRFIMPSYLYHISGNITDARIKIRQYIGTTPEAKAYRVTGSWTSGSLTWNNKPGHTATECSALATLDNENWYNFVVTTIIKKQLNGTYGDYGVMLKDNTESGTQHWSTFYSSEAASPNKPELHITFSSYHTVALRVLIGSTFFSYYSYPYNQVAYNLMYLDVPFQNKWGITFTKSYTTITSLIIDSCTDGVGVACSHASDGDCKNDLSNYYHHKNGIKNLIQIKNTYPTTGYDIFVTFVCGPLCSAKDGHHGIWGAAFTGGQFAIADQYIGSGYPSPDILKVRIIQHEISHLFGCHDGVCNDDCVMQGSFDTTSLYHEDIWCPNCASDFDPDLH